MKSSRRKIEELLWLTGTHAKARALYQLTLGRNSSKLRASMCDFYRPLLASAALVFDIGANVGKFAEIFSALGARVIAVEPNEDCIRHIQLSYGARIETIHAVSGQQNGLAQINLSDERDDVSSLSHEWIAAIKREHREYAGLWSRQVTVPMVTLDTLIDHFGVPYYIKIDVEGFEESVLNGLSIQPALLSFEFNRVFLDTTIRCLDKDLFADGSLFNFGLGDPVRFELQEWVRRDTLKEILGRIEKGDRYGDIFVKRPSQ